MLSEFPPPADHITLAWPVKLCDGIKQWRKVLSSFMQSFCKITVCKKQTENY